MIKCYAPWTNLDIDYQGFMRPCCKFNTNDYQDPKYGLIEGDFEKYINSSMLKLVKQDLMLGQWPAGCSKCKNDEAVNMVSKRQRDLQDLAHLHQDVKFSDPSDILSVTTELGISCNLACIICDHTKSTGWRPETKQIYNIVPASTGYTRAAQRARALTQLPPHQHLELQGGEPLTTNFKDHKLLLDHYIETGSSTNMTLRYHTNGTMWPSQELWQRWEKFKSVDLKLSIDGVGSVFEYTRWPGRWSEFEFNAAKFCALRDSGQNIVVSAQITASAYNCTSLDDIYDWCAQHQITDVFLNKIIWPIHLRLNVWPASARKIISEIMIKSKHSDVSNMGSWLSCAEDIEMFDKFVEFTETHNLYRKISMVMCSETIATLYQDRLQLLQQDRDLWWNRFYDAVKDPGWPECRSESQFVDLPEHIQLELVSQHKYCRAQFPNVTLPVD